MDSSSGQRCRSLPQILKRGVDPGADDTDGSKLVCQLQSPAKAGSQRISDARFLVQVLARDHERHPMVDLMKLLSGNAQRIEVIEKSANRSGFRRVAFPIELQEHDVSFARDADHGSRHPRRIAPNDRAVG